MSQLASWSPTSSDHPLKSAWSHDQGVWQHFVSGAPACREVQYLQGKIKLIQEKWDQTFKDLIQSGQGLASTVTSRLLFSTTVLFACVEKSWLQLKERCFVIPAVKQGLPANHHPENWMVSLHNWSWYLLYFLLYGLLFLWKSYCVDR